MDEDIWIKIIGGGIFVVYLIASKILGGGSQSESEGQDEVQVDPMPRPKPKPRRAPSPQRQNQVQPPKPAMKPNLVETEEAKTEEERVEFDLRKAVIMAEILTPKYKDQ